MFAPFLFERHCKITKKNRTPQMECENSANSAKILQILCEFCEFSANILRISAPIYLSLVLMR